MTKSELNQIVQEQLALDLGCEPALLDPPDNVVVEWQDKPGRRKYRNNTPVLEIAIWQGKIAAACGAELLPWASGYFPRKSAQWLFQPARYREIDAALAPLGYEIGDAHKFYLPDLTLPPVNPLQPVCWYEGEALEQFRGDSRWEEALAFQPLYPDMLAVAALDGAGQPVAMAGASRDGARFWQIGIIVQPEHRGRELAANLTALLKDELLRREIVPFYGTAESHIISQNVARGAGFYPAFAYLYAKPKGTN